MELPYHEPTENLLMKLETKASMERSIQGHGWQDFFEGFDEKVWPEFEKRGFSKDTALLAWQMNSMINELSDLVVSFEVFASGHAGNEDDEEDE